MNLFFNKNEVEVAKKICEDYDLYSILSGNPYESWHKTIQDRNQTNFTKVFVNVHVKFKLETLERPLFTKNPRVNSNINATHNTATGATKQRRLQLRVRATKLI